MQDDSRYPARRSNCGAGSSAPSTASATAILTRFAAAATSDGPRTSTCSRAWASGRSATRSCGSASPRTAWSAPTGPGPTSGSAGCASSASARSSAWSTTAAGPAHQPGRPVASPRARRLRRAVAERYPWVEDYTPVNEPLTTARFSGLYGHWYPARPRRPDLRPRPAERSAAPWCSPCAPSARSTPPRGWCRPRTSGKTFSTPALAYQAEFENERRWLTFDLLCGRVGPRPPDVGLPASGRASPRRSSRWFADAPVPARRRRRQLLPDQRALPGPPARVATRPNCTAATAGTPTPTWRRSGSAPRGPAEPAALLREAWERYRLPAGGHRGPPRLHPRGAAALARGGLGRRAARAGRGGRRPRRHRLVAARGLRLGQPLDAGRRTLRVRRLRPARAPPASHGPGRHCCATWRPAARRSPGPGHAGLVAAAGAAARPVVKPAPPPRSAEPRPMAGRGESGRC